MTSTASRLSREKQQPLFAQWPADDELELQRDPETALLLHWIPWVLDFIEEIADSDEILCDDDFFRRLYSWWRTRTHAELKKPGFCVCDEGCFNRAGYFGEQEQARRLDRPFPGFLKGVALTARRIAIGVLNHPVGYPDLLMQYQAACECLAVDAVARVLCGRLETPGG